ncbi:MAG: hypothetical protein HY784_07855 [Chloroflexi bacterium]|nr:hypothetical protein [Chloroflexota bacterium]
MALAGERPVLDLSSAHYQQVALKPELPPFRCIDCHRGNQGLLHRAGTLTLGARDSLIWLAGLADPAIEKTALAAPGLLAAACTRCHAEALLVAGFNNHFHNQLPQARRSTFERSNVERSTDHQPAAEALPAPRTAGTAVLCVDCHRAHVHSEGAEQQAYLDVVTTVYPACVLCHRETGAGPLDLAP